MNQPVFPHLPASTTANTVKTLKLTQVEHACSFALAWWKLLVACLLVLSCHVLSATLTTPMGTSRNSDLSALSHILCSSSFARVRLRQPTPTDQHIVVPTLHLDIFNLRSQFSYKQAALLPEFHSKPLLASTDQRKTTFRSPCPCLHAKNRKSLPVLQ